MNTAVLVPSRGRPHNIDQLIDAFINTGVRGHETSLYVLLDKDDPTVDKYVEVMSEYKDAPFPIVGRIAERMRMGGTLNDMAPIAAQFFGVVGFMGDDHRPRTDGWDKMIQNHFLDTVNSVLYGDDLVQRQRLPTAVFMDSRIIRRLGWMVIPGQIHLFMDNLWKTLGEQLGTLAYRPDIVIEHVHPITQKVEWDQTYIEANAGDVWEHDEKLYNDWVANQMAADIEKIKDE